MTQPRALSDAPSNECARSSYRSMHGPVMAASGLDAAMGGTPSVAAVTSVLTSEILGLCRTTWPSVHRHPPAMVRAATTATRIFELETVRLPFDQCLEAEALGCRLSFDAAYPKPVEHKDADLQELVVPRLVGKGRTEAVLEAVRLTREEVDKRMPLLAAVAGPFTVLNYLLGPTRIMVWSRRSPDFLRSVAEHVAEVTAEYANQLISAGADAIVVEDMAASPDVLNPAIFGSVEVGPLRRLASDLSAPSILHICGGVGSILEQIAGIGFDGFHIDPKTELARARAAVGKMLLAGGIGTRILLDGTPQEVSEAASACLSMSVDIVAPACALYPGTKTPNMLAMARAVKKKREET